MNVSVSLSLQLPSYFSGKILDKHSYICYKTHFALAVIILSHRVMMHLILLFLNGTQSRRFLENYAFLLPAEMLKKRTFNLMGVIARADLTVQSM